MIENQTTKILYSADGTNKVWEIPFAFIDNADIVLNVKLPTETDFTKITENYLVNKNSATVTYPVSGNAVVEGSSVLIERNTPVTQLESSIVLHFTSADMERGLDKITMVAQEIKNKTDGYADDIKTLRNDVDDLGDQVQGIESKIPQDATSANQLVDKASMAETISAGLATKQDTLTAGANITIQNNVISATGIGGGGATGGAVNSVNGKTGDVVLSASDVGAATTKYVDDAVAGAGGDAESWFLLTKENYTAQQLSNGLSFGKTGSYNLGGYASKTILRIEAWAGSGAVGDPYFPLPWLYGWHISNSKFLYIYYIRDGVSKMDWEQYYTSSDSISVTVRVYYK